MENWSFTTEKRGSLPSVISPFQRYQKFSVSNLYLYALTVAAAGAILQLGGISWDVTAHGFGR